MDRDALATPVRRRVQSTRDRVEALRDSISRAADAMDEAAAVAGEPGHTGRKPRRQGLRGEVLAALASGPATVTELSVRLDHPRGAIGTALLGLMRDGLVERIDRGLYALVQQGADVSSRERLIDCLRAELEAAERVVSIATEVLADGRADVRRLNRSIRRVVLKTPSRQMPRPPSRKITRSR